MKWLKVFLTLTVSVGLLSIVACGDDDDDSPTGPSTSDLTGTWEDDEGYLITFKDGGKLEDEEGMEGTWVLNGDKLTITMESYDIVASFVMTISISGNKMTATTDCNSITFTSDLEGIDEEALEEMVDEMESDCRDDPTETLTKQ